MKPITITLTHQEVYSLSSAIGILGEVLKKLELEAPEEFKEHIASVIEKMAYELVNQLGSEGARVADEALKNEGD